MQDLVDVITGRGDAQGDNAMFESSDEEESSAGDSGIDEEESGEEDDEDNAAAEVRREDSVGKVSHRYGEAEGEERIC
jgi:hypothetical protein